jgi:hypothetical protein
MADNDAVWKDPRPLGRAATAVLWGELAVFGFDLLRGIVRAYWRSETPLINAEAEVWLVLLGAAAVLCGAIVVLMWVYRVCRNTQASGLGANRSAWGALLWNLVPIASLWKPFETFSETWRVAEDPHGWRQAKAPPLLLWWWGLWLGQGLAGYFVALFFSTVTGGAPSTGQIVGNAFTGALSLAYILLFIRIVGRLTQMQVSSRAQDVFD